MLNNRQISFIVAADENNCIGKDNKLLCHLPADLKYFKELSWGNTLIMGRKTFESMDKRVLPGRDTIVITRQENYHADGVQIADSVEKAVELADNEKQVFIIGGAEIFNQSIKYADVIYLTRIYHAFECDTFFPVISENEWEMKEDIKYDADIRNPYSFSFIKYLRKKF